MTDLDTIMGKCEKDLIDNQSFSNHTVALLNSLSNHEKILFNYVLKFFSRLLIVPLQENKRRYTSHERIRVCRLIPFAFFIHTGKPTWSSSMLNNAVSLANEIPDIKLSEIAIAFLEVINEFNSPLNCHTFNFCVDFSRVFCMSYRNRSDEFYSLITWKNSSGRLNAASAFLKYALVPYQYYSSDFIYETVFSLIGSGYLQELVPTIREILRANEHNLQEKLLNLLTEARALDSDRDIISSLINDLN